MFAKACDQGTAYAPALVGSGDHDLGDRRAGKVGFDVQVSERVAEDFTVHVGDHVQTALGGVRVDDAVTQERRAPGVARMGLPVNVGDCRKIPFGIDGTDHRGHGG